IYSSEWAFYVFDTILIFIAFIVYIVFFIGRNFPRSSNVARAPSVGHELQQRPVDSSQLLVSKDHPV
ncbi:hypothetical protein GGH17_006036, partial [Coemansia sp. RSA 788]